jgi:hypothetical protein
VRWLRELKRWYGPNASTFLEAMDSGQATSPQSAAGLVQLCFGFVARKLRNTGAGWRRAFDPDDPVAGFPHVGLPGGAEGIQTDGHRGLTPSGRRRPVEGRPPCGYGLKREVRDVNVGPSRWILSLPRPGGPVTGLIRCCSLHRMAPASGLPISAASGDEIDLAEPCH